MDMQHFSSDGVDIAYLDHGEGDPILLIHGFASNAHVNWVHPGWVNHLADEGRRVIAIDNRGHGKSEKLHDPAYYGAPIMAEDARRLLDHLDIATADVMGYSMGARITAFLALDHPARVRSAIFGGLGIGMVTGVGAPEPIIDALEARSMDDVADQTGRMFRAFAEQTGGDLRALAACMRSSRVKITAERLSGLRLPVLVAVGSKDDIAGSPEELAALIPDAEALDIPNRDHNRAVGDRVYKAGVTTFLSRLGTGS